MFEWSIKLLVAGLVEQFDKSLPVRQHPVHRFLEIAFMRRSLLFWPIIVGPVHALIMRILTKVQDIPLRETDMFDQLPDAVRQPIRRLAQMFIGNTGNGFLESRM